MENDFITFDEVPEEPVSRIWNIPEKNDMRRPRMVKVTEEHFEMAYRAFLKTGAPMDAGLCEAFAGILAMESAGRDNFIKENAELRGIIKEQRAAIERLTSEDAMRKRHPPVMVKPGQQWSL